VTSALAELSNAGSFGTPFSREPSPAGGGGLEPAERLDILGIQYASAGRVESACGPSAIQPMRRPAFSDLTALGRLQATHFVGGGKGKVLCEDAHEETGPAAHVELVVDTLQVRVHSVRGDSQGAGDRCLGLILEDALEDL
jgi:hypothetical protein